MMDTPRLFSMVLRTLCVRFDVGSHPVQWGDQTFCILLVPFLDLHNSYINACVGVGLGLGSRLNVLKYVLLTPLSVPQRGVSLFGPGIYPH